MRGCYALLLVALLPDPASAQRVLHWVIRVSSLEDTISFATDVLGMQVLRHEENDEPCPLTCNGVFDTPWSKTMVGYGPEDAHYALELTYNYGIPSYEVGGGLQRFVIHMDGAAVSPLHRTTPPHRRSVRATQPPFAQLSSALFATCLCPR